LRFLNADRTFPLLRKLTLKYSPIWDEVDFPLLSQLEECHLESDDYFSSLFQSLQRYAAKDSPLQRLKLNIRIRDGYDFAKCLQLDPNLSQKVTRLNLSISQWLPLELTRFCEQYFSLTSLTIFY